MANIIILEGLSRTGKSSIAAELSEKLGFKSISIKNKMPEYITNLAEFYHGIHVMTNEMYKAFPEETFILDRSFLSEIVYSKFFNRESLACKDDLIANILMDHGTDKLIDLLVDAEADNYRLHIREDQHTGMSIFKMFKINIITVKYPQYENSSSSSSASSIPSYTSLAITLVDLNKLFVLLKEEEASELA